VADPTALLEYGSGSVLVVARRMCFSRWCVNATEQRRRRRCVCFGGCWCHLGVVVDVGGVGGYCSGAGGGCGVG
jgi:hypothetical protein